MSAADLAISVVILVVAVVAAGFGAFVGLFLLAFIDHCPPATCSIEGVEAAVSSAVLFAGLAVSSGIVLTIVSLVRRKPAWPWALGSLVVCVVVLVLGAVGYQVAAGA